MKEYYGVVLSKNENGKFDVYRVSFEGEWEIEEFPRGQNRAKGHALKEAELVLVQISQEITRGEIFKDK